MAFALRRPSVRVETSHHGARVVPADRPRAPSTDRNGSPISLSPLHAAAKLHRPYELAAAQVSSPGYAGIRSCGLRRSYGDDGVRRCGANRAPWFNVGSSWPIRSGWLPSHKARAATVGSTPVFPHHAASSPQRCTSRWCPRQRGTVNSSLTLRLSARLCVKRRWWASAGRRPQIRQGCWATSLT